MFLGQRHDAPVAEIDELRLFLAPLLLGGSAARDPLEGKGVEQISEALRALTSARSSIGSPKTAMIFRFERISPQKLLPIPEMKAGTTTGRAFKASSPTPGFAGKS